MNNIILQLKPLVHGVVDEGVDRRVGHSEPVEEEVDILNEGELDDGIVMENVDEVNIVRKPTDAKQDNDQDKHLYNFLLVLLSPGQCIGIVSQDLCAREGEAHPGVAEQHHHPWQQVGHQEEN